MDSKLGAFDAVTAVGVASAVGAVPAGGVASAIGAAPGSADEIVVVGKSDQPMTMHTTNTAIDTSARCDILSFLRRANRCVDRRRRPAPGHRWPHRKSPSGSGRADLGAGP